MVHIGQLCIIKNFKLYRPGSLTIVFRNFIYNIIFFVIFFFLPIFFMTIDEGVMKLPSF
jgi:hypothetical protein